MNRILLFHEQITSITSFRISIFHFIFTHNNAYLEYYLEERNTNYTMLSQSFY